MGRSPLKGTLDGHDDRQANKIKGTHKAPLMPDSHDAILLVISQLQRRSCSKKSVVEADVLNAATAKWQDNSQHVNQAQSPISME